MKKIILILLLSISLFALQKQNQKVVLQLGWKHQFQFAGYYVAKELGYYKKAGIDIEMNEFDFKTNISTVLENKEADFAIARSSLLLDKANGKDVVALGAIFQNSPLMLMTRADTGINSLKDLKGKQIMITDDAKGTAPIMSMLFSNGISKKDIEIIPHSFNLDDLINKNVDAMGCYMSNEPIVMRDKGIDYKVFHPKDYGFHFYSDILFTSSEYMKKNPQLTKNFYDATIEGWEYAFEHISETAELIHKKYNTQNKTLIHLIKEGEILKNMTYRENKSIGDLDKDQLKEIVNVYKVLGLVNKDIDFESFIYEHNHPTEFAFSLSYDDIFHIVLLFIVLLLVSGASLLFISLRKQWLITKNNLNNKIEEQRNKIDEQHRTIIAQSKISAVGDMLSNIAHQWRQPLNIITLNTAKLETAILLNNEIKNEDIIDISEAINKQSLYLSNTIDDFRNYFNSDIDSVATFELSSAIESVNGLTKDMFNHNNIETVITLEDCSITHNQSLLVQALLNIINNAKDALIENKVEHKFFFIDVLKKKNNIVIKLKDNAGGIDKKVITQIFDPYYTTKHKTQGTGLGLYITYEIITKHFNGSIEVNNRIYTCMNEKYKGAEFTIIIPSV